MSKALEIAEIGNSLSVDGNGNLVFEAGVGITALDVTGTTTSDQYLLEAISATIASTAVDVFVYDTSKDSDGGAWRKRTQGTSWYNETLGTATRGNRKEFPAVAVIVAESNKVTIYDGDDPALPMWRVTNQIDGVVPQFWRQGRSATSLYALNGKLVIGIATDTPAGLAMIDFAADLLFRWSSGGTSGGTLSGVYNDASATATLSGVLPALVSTAVNDVAMTVLPNAPIDAATGLPVPTIAVATAGGVSVIKDDGTVVDISGVVVGHINIVGEVLFTSVTYSNVYVGPIPAADVAYTTYRAQSDVLRFDTEATDGLALLSTTGSGVYLPSENYNVGSPAGLTTLVNNTTTPANGMVNYITSTYNTGWMNGDIKGAFLSDTDTTSLVGGELVTNGTFDSDTDWTKGTGWTIGSGVATAVGAGGYFVQTNVLGNGVSKVIKVSWDQTITSGTRFRFFARNDTDSASVPVLSGSATGGATYGSGNCNGSGTFTVYVQTTDGFAFKLLAESGNNGTIDNVSVTEVDADRSANNNSLTINGTITRTPVATGADLVAYSGFSASNYLEQPYNSALDFGTGDFCYMGWSIGQQLYDTFFVRSDGSTTSTEFMLQTGANAADLRFYVGGAFVSRSGLLPTSGWHHISVLREAGLIKIYSNGRLVDSFANTSNVTQSGATLIFGDATNSASSASGDSFKGSLALWRISATAPTAAQIAKIYEDEKYLFQDGAQATLYGASDAVTALAYDDATELLHVGTSQGRSVFQGLRRVDNTTSAVGAAISASNGLVAED